MGTNQWHTISVGSLLTFSSPVSLSSPSGQGVDTAFSEWHGEGLTVRVDSGPFVDPLTRYRDRPNYQESVAPIDERTARVVAFDEADGSRFTAAHFSALGSPADRVTVVVISRGSRSHADALRMIQGIRFRR